MSLFNTLLGNNDVWQHILSFITGSSLQDYFQCQEDREEHFINLISTGSRYIIQCLAQRVNLQEELNAIHVDKPPYILNASQTSKLISIKGIRALNDMGYKLPSKLLTQYIQSKNEVAVKYLILDCNISIEWFAYPCAYLFHNDYLIKRFRTMCVCQFIDVCNKIMPYRKLYQWYREYQVCQVCSKSNNPFHNLSSYQTLKWS